MNAGLALSGGHKLGSARAIFARAERLARYNAKMWIGRFTIYVASVVLALSEARAETGRVIGDDFGVGLSWASQLPSTARHGVAIFSGAIMEQLRQARRGETVFLSLGTNDAVGAALDVHSKVAAILAAANAQGIKLVWMGPPCVLKPWEQYSNRLDRILKEQLAGTSATYVSLQEPKFCDRSVHTPEGVHFNMAGYMLMWRVAATAVDFPMVVLGAPTATDPPRPSVALTLDCKPDIQEYIRDKIVRIVVSVQGHYWQVTDIAESGKRFERSNQYYITDTSDLYNLSWEGVLLSHQNIKMIGSILKTDGRYYYVESIYDWDKNNTKVNEFTASCYPLPNVPDSDEITQVSPKSSQAEVPIEVSHGGFVVPVVINGVVTLNFTIDSGASDVSVPADVVLTLIRAHTLEMNDFLGQKTYTLADGSTVPSQTFRIRSLKVGDRVLENVVGSIASINADLLLGQSFLSRFKSWSIDNQRQVLILN
jgi:hypothetical protein